MGKRGNPKTQKPDSRIQKLETGIQSPQIKEKFLQIHENYFAYLLSINIQIGQVTRTSNLTFLKQGFLVKIHATAISSELCVSMIMRI